MYIYVCIYIYIYIYIYMCVLPTAPSTKEKPKRNVSVSVPSCISGLSSIVTLVLVCLFFCSGFSRLPFRRDQCARHHQPKRNQNEMGVCLCFRVSVVCPLSSLCFLFAQVSLVSDLDATDAHGTMASSAAPPVKLMTIHASKGDTRITTINQ